MCPWPGSQRGSWRGLESAGHPREGEGGTRYTSYEACLHYKGLVRTLRAASNLVSCVSKAYSSVYSSMEERNDDKFTHDSIIKPHPPLGSSREAVTASSIPSRLRTSVRG